MIALLLLGCTEPESVELDPELQAALLDGLDAAREQAGAPGAQLHVWVGDARFTAVSGQARVSPPEDVRDDHVFRMASITKMYVGALAAELDAEGTLDLDAPASELVPGAPHAERYSIRQALQHRTGLADYVETFALLSGLADPWEPEALLALVDSEPLGFEPGSAYLYSNTNYVVAGLAIEAATGRPWQAQVRERFVEPLGLERITFPTEEPLEHPIAFGYLGDGPSLLEANDVDASSAWAVGEIIGDCADIAALTRGLVLRETLSDAAHATWVEPGDSESISYGLGVELEPGRIGHSGSILGFQSRVWVDPESGTTVAVGANSFTSEADVIAEFAWQTVMER